MENHPRMDPWKGPGCVAAARRHEPSREGGKDAKMSSFSLLFLTFFGVAFWTTF